MRWFGKKAKTARPRKAATLASRLRRLRRRGVRRSAIILAALAVVTALGWAVASDLPSRTVLAAENTIARIMVTARLTVHEIELTGRREAEQGDIVAALHLRADEAILNVDLGAARERLESLGWIAEAEVSRKLPSTILVRLTEREPFALWQRGGRIALIDRSGEIIAEDHLGRFTSLPLVVGEGGAETAAKLIDLIRTTPDLEVRVASLIRVSKRRWNVRFDNGVDLYLPEVGQVEAWRRLVALQRDDEILSRNLTHIDLRAADRAVIGVAPEIAARLRDPGERT
jgi:cell division protein FtsQ